jgi:hypothetical protein
MNAQSEAILKASAGRLFPELSQDEVLAELLLERAQKNLIKYQVLSRQFATKYASSFEVFRQRILTSHPDALTEQDYFDWELAVTGIADMQEALGLP